MHTGDEIHDDDVPLESRDPQQVSFRNKRNASDSSFSLTYHEPLPLPWGSDQQDKSITRCAAQSPCTLTQESIPVN